MKKKIWRKKRQFFSRITLAVPTRYKCGLNDVWNRFLSNGAGNLVVIEWKIKYIYFGTKIWRCRPRVWNLNDDGFSNMTRFQGYDWLAIDKSWLELYRKSTAKIESQNLTSYSKKLGNWNVAPLKNGETSLWKQLKTIRKDFWTFSRWGPWYWLLLICIWVTIL